MIVIDSEYKLPLFEKVSQTAFEALELSGDCYVEVDFVSEGEIRALNKETRNVDKVTDVLSYPALYEIMPFTVSNYPYEYNSETKSVGLGSIVICEAVAKSQAEEYGHSEEREKAYLFLHGLLHLLGYDHIEDDDKKIMREKEEEILNRLGITRE
ncbi:MAG: rRNA maturation RNase YbeY [Clostridiales bacterium]|nr:rRNA maturation RNase YbeY [Clostridiales bacterium]